MRREIIMELMCSNTVDSSWSNGNTASSSKSYFAELSCPDFYAKEALLAIDENSISVVTKGRMFVRAFAMSLRSLFNAK